MFGSPLLGRKDAAIVSQVSGVPLYEQIVEQVRQQIMAGELAPGTALPSLRVLAGELRVSLITTTRAYNDLAAEGLIVNVPGKGSFVAEIDPYEARIGPGVIVSSVFVAWALVDVRTAVLSWLADANLAWLAVGALAILVGFGAASTAVSTRLYAGRDI